MEKKNRVKSNAWLITIVVVIIIMIMNLITHHPAWPENEGGMFDVNPKLQHTFE